jgi:hypothetical protein
MKKEELYTCIWCWFKTFNEVFSEYEICPICNYEDTSWWISHPNFSYNEYEKSLIEYQQEILKRIPCNIKEYKKWKKKYIRNNLWKPINKDELNEKYEYLPKIKYHEYKKCYPNSNNYDIYFQEAQKYNPDEKVHLDC